MNKPVEALPAEKRNVLSRTDKYFTKSREIIEKFGDRTVTYGVFMRRGDHVYHTYSAYARGQDHLALPFQYLDLTPYGRQEGWEDSPPGWPQKPTYG